MLLVLISSIAYRLFEICQSKIWLLCCSDVALTVVCEHTCCILKALYKVFVVWECGVIVAKCGISHSTKCRWICVYIVILIAVESTGICCVCFQNLLSVINICWIIVGIFCDWSEKHCCIVTAETPVFHTRADCIIVCNKFVDKFMCKVAACRLDCDSVIIRIRNAVGICAFKCRNKVVALKFLCIIAEFFKCRDYCAVKRKVTFNLAADFWNKFAVVWIKHWFNACNIVCLILVNICAAVEICKEIGSLFDCEWINRFQKEIGTARKLCTERIIKLCCNGNSCVWLKNFAAADFAACGNNICFALWKFESDLTVFVGCADRHTVNRNVKTLSRENNCCPVCVKAFICSSKGYIAGSWFNISAAERNIFVGISACVLIEHSVNIIARFYLGIKIVPNAAAVIGCTVESVWKRRSFLAECGGDAWTAACLKRCIVRELLAEHINMCCNEHIKNCRLVRFIVIAYLVLVFIRQIGWNGDCFRLHCVNSAVKHAVFDSGGFRSLVFICKCNCSDGECRHKHYYRKKNRNYFFHFKIPFRCLL